MDIHEEVLIAIRQIIRAVDLHSRQLNKDFGLTGPQLLIMRAIRSSGEVTIRQLSINTNMSQATATSIIDRLEKRGMVIRCRNTKDRRKVNAYLTDQGNIVLDQAPLPLQDNFIKQFQRLNEWEQTLILSSVQRISTMMNAQDLEVAPVLEVGFEPNGQHHTPHP
ncbi:MarR family winged helix-turn-helix transcriptional regulator [Photobacterium sp. TY1-4]|uniref:MarR family winged helix-turn-helix transcriptional regulator n=1 Tax=Photobacterium sp. TY1-4 TaxID=2899122 RepID=UPI0021C07A90|nr:MarR family transcriptional regulator [Photobacterium sp. TY1-4]UXI03756.1 MarR family transcriptional regulator [Photobacterium sp. TY1-4]